LPIGVEGQALVAGTGNAGTIYVINRLDESAGLFDPTSSLHRIVKVLLDRGAGPVLAVASVKSATAPTLVQRQAAWQKLEADINTRIRLTDSETQADLSALAVSCANANLLYNKQVCFVGMPVATAKAAQITAATSLASGGTDAASRTVLVAPGVYDDTGTLRGGSFAAASVAAEVAKNDDLSNDLDLWSIPLLTQIELATDGRPVFQRQVVAGLAVDDYEDLLQGGVSPLQPSRIAGGVMTTHLRTVYITNSSYDNLYTRLIVDGIFVTVRDYIYQSNYLRMPNTQQTRDRLKSGVDAILRENAALIGTVNQPDGTQGYNVTVVSSTDGRQLTVGYEGIVVRGINTIKVAANLSIPV
jgi:hypothetical protein